jgi:HTH-type transcriptional regulator/antitoxin HigA
MGPDNEHRTPGQYIEALLDEHGWTKRTLAVVLGVHDTALSKIFSGKQALGAELALTLSELFNVPAENFLQLQQSYDLARARLVTKPDPGRSARAHLFGKLPISEMIKRGWIGGKDLRDPKVERELARFFGVASSAEIEILPHAAKKTDVVGEVTASQLAWLYRVRQVASDMVVPPFSERGARESLPRLRELLVSAEGVRQVPRTLEESGIRFVLVEALPSSKIDGVCFWIDNEPVIGMSLRLDRIDNFWFVLRHEVEHVLQRHGQGAVIIDADLEGERAGVGSGVSEEERQANAAAAEFCIPQKDLDGFIRRKSPFFSERDIVSFARMLQVHPGIVAGQLQHRTGRFDRFRNHQVKVRSTIAPSAIVDGWGDVAPVGN